MNRPSSPEKPFRSRGDREGKISLSTAVLVNVDDHEAARYARTRVLQQAGFLVHEAATGVSAMQLIAEVRPDLVLLDVHLPDVNGIEVCRRIRARDEGTGMIILQVSASAVSAPHATAALNIGADGYLIEPVDPDVLVATVRAFLRLRAAERALSVANTELSEKNAALNTLNKALRRSNEDLEHFAYVASHDLQEPLRNITTHLQLLERITTGRFDDSERHLFDVVVKSAQRMSLLIHDVLAYSGLGKQVMESQPVDLKESLDWAMQNLSEGISEAEATIVADKLPVVRGDRVQLGQVFQNLIGNSIKYRSHDRALRVEISARQDDAGEWTIRVADNGMGIAEQFLPDIFLPFKRLHGFDIPGNGIGLTLCRRIIEAQNGRIWAESVEGEGAAFLFTLESVAD